MRENQVIKLIKNLKLYGLDIFLKYYGVYRGSVVDNIDVNEQGMVQVTCPSVKGDSTPLKAWAYPKSMYAGENMGVFFPPEIGSNVWVEFENGDLRNPVYDGGFWTRRDSVVSNQYPTSETVGGNSYPSVRGIVTRYGNKLLFRDLDMAETVTNMGMRIETGGGHYIDFNDEAEAEQIEVKNSLGHSMKMNPEGVAIETTEGNKLSIDKDGNINIEVSANSEINVGADCNLNVTGNATITSPSTTVTGGMLTVNGASPPEGSGPFCSLPTCLFSGAPHAGTKVMGT